jgi:glycosyltransferase involved in cell wall biosynthesis
VIPNPIDTDVFKPIDKAFSRRVLNLPQNRPILLFGAIGGVKDLRKGFDLLLDALRCLKAGTLTDLLCVVCGQFTPASPPPIPYETRWMAQVHDDPLLVLLYNAADVLVVPSRQDNLPQTATEAQACGCPVVAFRATGLPDIVAHDETGYLAEPYDPTGLAAGVTKLLADETFRNQVASAARQHALNRWRASDIARQMMRIYDSLASSIPRPTL